MTSTAEGYGFGPSHAEHNRASHHGDASMSFEQAGERTMSLPPLPPDSSQASSFPAASVYTPLEPAQPSDFLSDSDDEIVRARSGRARRSRTRTHTMAWIVTLGLLCALLALAAGSFAVAQWYFKDKAAPGVSLGTTSVTGKNAQELKNIVDHAVADSTITISDSQGTTVKATLRELGVNVDGTATVSNLLNAKSGNMFQRLNPWNTSKVPLVATTNALTGDAYVANAFVKQSDRAVASSIAYDTETKQFVATEGRGGSTPVSKPVNEAITAALRDPGHAAAVNIAYRHVNMPISLQSATQAAQDANGRLGASVTVTADNESFTIPSSVVATWITATGDPAKGSIALQYNTQAITDYVNTQIPSELNRKMVTQQEIVDGNGKPLMTKVHGIDGVTLKNVSALAAQVTQALSNGQTATIKADADVTAHDVKQTVSKYRIVVDRSKQVAIVYQGDTVVKTFLICTGKSGHDETDLGTYAIYLRYNTQDMTGKNDDGSTYLSKGVRWVSYFDGGEGFHTALWNYDGIAKGDPSANGSHGCVNMYEQDAQWIYDNCPEGTLVTVIGDQPTSAVR